MPASSYRAEPDRTTVLLTGVAGLLTAAPVFYALLSRHLGGAAFLALLLGLWLAGAFLFAPSGYAVEFTSLVVRRAGGDERIYLGDLREARLMDVDDGVGLPRTGTGGVFHLIANPGVFGVYGVFANVALGRHTWYATRRDDLVLLRTADHAYVVSPSEPERFVEELQQFVKDVPELPLPTPALPDPYADFDCEVP